MLSISNFINLHDTFYLNNSIYIISEYAEKGDLGNFIENTKEYQKKQWNNGKKQINKLKEKVKSQ